jgi:hypothetical protein
MFTFITLPTDWLTTVKGTTGELASDVMPVVLLILGITIAILAVKFIVGLTKQ